ncbi:uncharacterized protein LOC119462700 [Dermacentor silvarum]|uniref:uncharacterized protein LOC119462700 n=1 Tax=Dermacentor silvarum TaxID=543639 RepID=UPI00189953CB|nr:uncharacterized protein LOC119462700 [Dermacentor silvarum]
MQCIYVIFLIGHATGTFDYSGRATLDDVKTFFNTAEKILLLRRSYSRKIDNYDPKCIYSRKTTVSEDVIALIEHFDYGDRRSKLHCTAYRVYMKMSKEEGMDVAPLLNAAKVEVPWCPFTALEATSGTKTHTQGYKDGRNYTFQYFDSADKCAVITFSDKECDTKCELHVWESFRYKVMTNCIREYEQLCSHRTNYTPYEPDICTWEDSHYEKTYVFIPHKGSPK